MRMEVKHRKRKDHENHEIISLLEKLTHSGKDSLNVNQLKILKTTCSFEEKNLEIVYKELMKLLQKNHSEIRFSTVQVCNELFMNYDKFRSMLVDNIRLFLKYTIEDQLPPPKPAAKKLLKLVISYIDEWNAKFGDGVYKLRAAYNYLRKRKNVDFGIKEIVDPKKRMEEQEKERKTLILNTQLLKRATSEMKDMKQEVESTITSLKSCFSMLLPTPEEFNAKSPNVNDVSSDFEMRLFGVLDPRHSVQIQFDCGDKIQIIENDENSAILNAAKDAFTIINNRFLPKTKAWVELLRKVNDKSDSGISTLNQALVQENELNQLVYKYKILKIIPLPDQAEEVSSDSDLEEVVLPKPDKVFQQREEIGFLSDLIINDSSSKDVAHSDVNNIQNLNDKTNFKKQEQNSTTEKMSERKKQLLEVAPKLPYDIDLYHWEDEKLPTPTVLAVNCDGANFWTASASEDISEMPVPGGSSVLRTRVIEFSGKFEPVERACRVPLTLGKLCPRKDRIKCPFHGTIVDRDEKGNIIKEEDRVKLALIPNKPVIPDWQNPRLLAEIKAATGIDLKMPEKGKRKKKIKHPGLTDLNAAKKTPKARLAKKIFNKGSLKRVAAVMNKLDHKKHRDKFGDQFNYAHGTS